jgi:dTDP-glucose 4,6-dehydratase
MLDHTDWHVVCVDSFRHNGITDRLAAAVAGRTDRVTVMTHDLVVPFSGRQHVVAGDLDYVINVASACSVDQSIDDPASFIRNNVDLMLNVLELARRQPQLRQMIHFSTDEVYGPHQPDHLTEHRPSSPYAASKAAQEDICHAYRRTYDVPVVILNSANMFGERQSQLAFIPRVIRAVQRDDVVPIHAHNGKVGRRSYTYVGNVARYVVEQLTSPLTITRNRFVLGGQCEISNINLAVMIAMLCGKELRYDAVDVDAIRAGYDDHYPNFSVTWGPKLSYYDGLRQTVTWFLDHQDWLVA